MTTIKLLAFAVVVLLALSSYGYWHGRTHGKAMITLYLLDETGMVTPATNRLDGATVQFLDDLGTVLAHGKRMDSAGVVYLHHPKAGFCYTSGKTQLTPGQRRKAWEKCHRPHASWLPTWTGRAKQFQVSHPNCTTHKMPLHIKSVRPILLWLFWWIPSRYGRVSFPTTFYHTQLILKPEDCLKNKP